MRYLHVRWLHENTDDPVELYSEIDDDSWEVRKVEVYADGRAGFARVGESVGSTRLGLVPVPSIEAIAEGPEFRPEVITASEFERVWKAARSVVRAG